MKKASILILILIVCSCSEEVKYCEDHDDYDIELINRINTTRPSKDLLPFSEIEGIIQYRGHAAFGSFNHTIRVIKRDTNRIIQLFKYQNEDDPKEKEFEYIESKLTNEQFKTIDSKMMNLVCKPVSLEKTSSVCGATYEMIISQDNLLQAFSWDNYYSSKNSQENKLIKEEVLNLVGELMDLSHFPNGTKEILVRNSNKINDSLEIVVFPRHQYNYKYSELYFDNELVSQEIEDGVVKFNLQAQDTIDLKKRIQMKIILLNGDTLEM